MPIQDSYSPFPQNVLKVSCLAKSYNIICNILLTRNVSIDFPYKYLFFCHGMIEKVNALYNATCVRNANTNE